MQAGEAASPRFRRTARPSVSLGLPTTLILDGSRESRQIDPETTRDAVEILEADVAEAALDPGDVRDMEPCPVREVLLRQLPREPQVPDRGSEGDKEGTAIGGHAPTLLPTQTIRP